MDIDEKIYWQSKKHFLTMPWSFTTYKLSQDRVLVERGLLTTTYDQTLLYRVLDIKLTQTLIQKMCGTGTVTLTTRDRDHPVVLIQNVKEPYKVRELMSKMVEESRRRNRVITTDGGFG